MEDKLVPLIRNLRRKEKVEKSWEQFYNIVTQDTDLLCEKLNTRWLISVCDTIVDYGEPTEAANAMTIVAFTNMVKLWATSDLIYKGETKFKILDRLRLRSQELWDGMMAFRPIDPSGDMTWNLFKRLNKTLAGTPYLHKIFQTIVQRLMETDNPLNNMNKLHGNIFKNAIKNLG